MRTSSGRTVGRRSERPRRRSAWIAVAAVATIVGPVAWSMLETRAHRPTTHPSFDGVRYVFPDPDKRPDDAAGDATTAGARSADGSSLTGAGVPVVDEAVATLVAWRDGGATVGPTPARPRALGAPDPADTPTSTADLTERADVALAAAGLTGRWRNDLGRDLDGLRPPYLAPIELGDRASLLVVRRVHSGFVFAFEPGVGNVLYPYDTFLRAWSGRVRTFDPPVSAPEAWR